MKEIGSRDVPRGMGNQSINKWELHIKVSGTRECNMVKEY